MRTSREIRQQFIDFFVDKCAHTAVASSPVVPVNDPTLLFTNAGMNQFKDVFLGLGDRPYTRAVDTQKCIRAGGKHNDLEDVGRDTYHHTFFEMLGNWSFGDYFKQEAITWAWQLLTEVWGLEKDRLYATVFAGDASDGLEPDTEAENLWKQCTDIDPSHITRWSRKDNFWEMGDTGPCGPCSELHIDLTPDKSGADLVNRDDPRVIEIWNLVFIQFNRDVSGALAPLPARHVDTGMGFERICAVLQGKTSNYDTDVFTPIFDAIRQVTGARGYAGKMDDPIDLAYRVIADHIRTLTFAMTDGAHCGNEGRNYVLRRILRRAVHQGRQVLGVDQPFFCKLVPTVVDLMGDVFPELKNNPQAVADEIEEEETLFGKTLDRGISMFNRAAEGSRTIDGETAFELYATYGFPLDLTQVMARQRGMAVDAAGFEQAMAEHQDRSRGAADGGDAMQTLVEIVQRNAPTATEFVGYDRSQIEGARLLNLYQLADGRYQPVDRLAAGSDGAVVTDKTPFYAEGGGQVGDRGEIGVGDSTFAVGDTQKVGEVFFHLGRMTEGGFAGGDLALLTVDREARRPTMQHHTATHLLNHALRQVLGDHVSQRGSLVDPEKLRFDFDHPKAMTAAQLQQVQDQVNAMIAKDWPIDTQLADLDAAMQIHGLRAVFGEKYPERVRVVSVGRPVSQLLADPTCPDWPNYPIEFCGGTHLSASGEAERLAIVSEEAVAKGIRRITAVAGRAAVHAFEAADVLKQEIDRLMTADADALGELLSAMTDRVNQSVIPLVSKIALRDQLTAIQKKLKQHQKEQARQTAGDVADIARQLVVETEGDLIVAHLGEVDGKALRTAMDVVRKRKPDAAMMLAGTAGGKVALLAVVPESKISQGLKAGDWVKQTAPIVGGGGGGRPDMAQAGGKDPSKIEDAMAVAKTFAQEKLG